jgi:RNA polymerase sigma factor (sigma-70 family)
MTDAQDMELVRQFGRDNSEAAFTELVRRHINLVYSVARRCTRNDSDAQDVTQAVFITLARKAVTLREKTLLTGWLYETTRFTTTRLLRTNARRHAREQEAFMQSTLNEADTAEIWTQLAPHLEAAMSKLNAADRALLVLRFYENKTGAEAAGLLGIGEDAAHKRVARAIEKLRKFLAQRGVTISGAAIAGAVSANSIQAAPAGLAAIISATALSGKTVTTAAVVAATKAIAMTTFQKTIVTAALVATVSAGIFEAHQAAQLRTQNQTLQQQQASLTAQIQQLSQSLVDATNQLTGSLAENAQVKSNSNKIEMLKLRGEVTRLRTANAQNHSNDPTEEAAKGVAAKAKQLKQWLEKNPNEKIPELQYLTAQDWLRGANYSGDLKTDDDCDRALSQLRRDAKRTFAYSIGEALANYIAGNNGQLPGDISQLESYFNPRIDGTILQRYQILQTGNLSDIPNNEPLIAEKAPVDDQYDTLFKISATGFSYQGTGTSWVNGSGKGNFGTNITAKIKPFERQ